MQQTRNTFTFLNNLRNNGRKLRTISFQISDQNSVWIPWFLFCPVKCKYIHKFNLTKPYEENKYAFSHWTNNILHPHPIFSSMAQQSLGGDSLLVIDASRSLSKTPHSVGLPWTNDHPIAETSTWQHTTLTSDKTSVPPAGFEPPIPASEQPQIHTLDRVVDGSVPSLDLRFGIFLVTSFHTPWLH